MTDIALFAFERAWLTTVVVVSLLMVTFVLFGLWESSAYKHELATALGLDAWNAPI
jgi:hypothetical protein